MEILELLGQRESEWLDFKRQHYDNTAKLLHDILCLANSYSEHDRYLVFGVDDDGSLHGVAGDSSRKTSANLHDFLRQAPLNRIPTCELGTHVVQGHELDLLTIRNRPDKPFLLTKDFEKQGERVRNGVVYTRIGDTNVPLKESAPQDLVELMWRERFGLGLSPLERAERFLGEPERWKKMGDGYLYASTSWTSPSSPSSTARR
jgi:predicted HTH transcriptional regulator